MAALLAISAVFGAVGPSGKTDRVLRRMMAVSAASVAAMFVVALLGVHYSSSKLVVLLPSLRGDKWLHVTLILAVPVFLWREMERPRVAVLLPAVAAVFVLGNAPPDTTLFLLPLLVAVVALMARREVDTFVLAGAGGDGAGHRAGLGVVLLALRGHRLIGASLVLGAAVAVPVAFRPRLTGTALIAVVVLLAIV